MTARGDIEAVIWDMDGVLIDSEPFWQRAEIEIFGEFGLELEPEDCRRTMGLRVDEAVAFWRLEGAGWDQSLDQELMDRLMARMVELIIAEGRAMAGIEHALGFFDDRVGVQALATSSYPAIVDAVLDRLAIHDRFALTHSAQHEAFGKPHPGVYLTAAAGIGVDPTRCLAIEDSHNGVIAAKAARMRCLAVPEPGLRGHPVYGAADAVVDTLDLVDEALWAKLLNG